MDQRVFNSFRTLVYRMSGIALGEGKQALVSARIAKRMRALGIDDYGVYLDYIFEDKTGQEVTRLIDVISTNVTSFFRDSDQFEFLSQAVSEWLAGGERRFRIWSAASSSGEEPYSIGMILLEILQGFHADVKILATDISTNMLDRCRSGEYPWDRLRDLPWNLRDRYFDSGTDGGAGIYRVKPELKERIVFRRLNLATPPFPMKGPFDAVFCRNVMIYFDDVVRDKLVSEVYRLLKTGGYLFVGHAESLTGIASDFEMVVPSIFRKV